MLLALLSILGPINITLASSSDWVSAPKPKFPPEVLRQNYEGSVTIRAVVGTDGTVEQTSVVRSSGNRALDRAAARAVQRWKMRASAIKPDDRTQGREVIVEFREEAPVAARYASGVSAAFASVAGADVWRYAPFPGYSYAARAAHEQGTVWLLIKIGSNGEVADLRTFQSSGHPDLDESAIRAVRAWKAHERFEGRWFKLPVHFTMVRSSHQYQAVREVHDL